MTEEIEKLTADCTKSKKEDHGQVAFTRQHDDLGTEIGRADKMVDTAMRFCDNSHRKHLEDGDLWETADAAMRAGEYGEGTQTFKKYQSKGRYDSLTNPRARKAVEFERAPPSHVLEEPWDGSLMHDVYGVDIFSEKKVFDKKSHGGIN